MNPLYSSVQPPSWCFCLPALLSPPGSPLCLSSPIELHFIPLVSDRHDPSHIPPSLLWPTRWSADSIDWHRAGFPASPLPVWFSGFSCIPHCTLPLPRMSSFSLTSHCPSTPAQILPPLKPIPDLPVTSPFPVQELFMGWQGFHLIFQSHSVGHGCLEP